MITAMRHQAEPLPDRTEVADLIRPLGPLVGLGTRDPQTIRATLRKIGVHAIVVTPNGDGGWHFKGDGDFSGLIIRNGHRRVKAAPPDTPPVTPAARTQDRCPGSVAPAKPPL